MIPITRKELYLNKIVGNNDYSIPEKPISEEEFFFAEILGEAVQAPEPLTRYQMYLAKIAGRNIEIPYPEVRLEYFLARAAGMDVETPTPITREEIFWSNYSAIVDFEVEGVPPLTYKAIEGTLKNYRIYGNTGGVGDKTANQWGNGLIGDTHVSPATGLPEFYGGRCGIVTPISITGESSLFITFDSEKTGIRCMYSVLSEGVLVRRQTAISSGDTINVSDGEELYVAFYRFANDLEPDDITNIMLNSGSAALPYEPYGYRLLLTVNSSTVNIYLSAPLSKTNDTADYIDYADQKQYFADGTSAGVTLPALPTLSGTNTLSVGTEVQPSKVYIKGEFKKITTTYVQSIEPDKTNNKIIFVVRAYRSKNDRMVRTGLVATNDPAIGVNINVNSTVITSGCKVFVKEVAGVTPTTDNIKYTWTKTKVTDGEIWYVRSYEEYINSDNEQLIIYSDAAKATLDGII